MGPGQLSMRKYSEPGLFVALQGIKSGEKKGKLNIFEKQILSYVKLNVEINYAGVYTFDRLSGLIAGT